MKSYLMTVSKKLILWHCPLFWQPVENTHVVQSSTRGAINPKRTNVCWIHAKSRWRQFPIASVAVCCSFPCSPLICTRLSHCENWAIRTPAAICSFAAKSQFNSETKFGLFNDCFLALKFFARARRLANRFCPLYFSNFYNTTNEKLFNDCN